MEFINVKDAEQLASRISSHATTTPLSSSASTTSADEDSATYLHHAARVPLPEVPAAPGRVGSKEKVRDGHIQQVLWKTTPCSFFERGVCKKGESCSFAHGTTDMRVRPDLTKTVICSSWQRRRMCKAGDHCRFAHGPTDLRACRLEAQRAQETPSSNNRNRHGPREQPASPMGLMHMMQPNQCLIPSADMPIQIMFQAPNQMPIAMMDADMRYRDASKQTLQRMLELAMPDHYED